MFSLDTLSPNCHIITLGLHKVYVSYQTVVGYEGPFGKVRRYNSWGTTTGKHITKMGIKGFPIATEEEMDLILEKVGS